MIDFKIRVNPVTKEVDYTIGGSHDELMKIDLNKIKEFNTLIQKIKKVFPEEKTQIQSKKVEKISTEDLSDLKINVPDNLVDAIETIADEKIKLPLLWYHSTKPIMTVGEFLETVSSTGFSLSPSWHPSVGGNFAAMLVNGDKMFRPKGKRGREKLWDLTDVSKLKIKAEIKKLESK